jgi:hypothetical protein
MKTAAPCGRRPCRFSLLDVVNCDHRVGVAASPFVNVDYRERRNEVLDRYLVERHTASDEVGKRIHLGSDVLVNVPPIGGDPMLLNGSDSCLAKREGVPGTGMYGNSGVNVCVKSTMFSNETI